MTQAFAFFLVATTTVCGKIIHTFKTFLLRNSLMTWPLMVCGIDFDHQKMDGHSRKSDQA